MDVRAIEAWNTGASGRWIARCLASIGLAAGLAGCNIERGEGTYGPQRSADAGDAAGRSSDAASAALGEGDGPGTMTGTWMLIHERSTCVATLRTEEQLTRATYRIRIEQTGASLREKRRICDISLTPVLGQSISIPRDVLEQVRFLDLDRGVVSRIGRGGSYTSSTEAAFWGVDPRKMQAPLSEPLPQTPDAPAEYDADEDGSPGVTFDLQDGACGRYTGQRQLIRYRGTFTTPNQIDGISTGHTDTVVFGASQGLCEIKPEIRANDGDSRFRMYRIDGRGGAFDADTDDDGTISCEEVRAIETSQAYPPREPSDERCKEN